MRFATEYGVFPVLPISLILQQHCSQPTKRNGMSSSLHVLMTDPLEVLKQLVAIPSVNPMGREETEPAFGEGRLTDFLESLFAKLDMPTQRHPVAPGRENLYALLAGDVPPEKGGVFLLFDAHQDTVPVEGMTDAPWTPTIRDDRLYGRGACDTKGGMAAMIAVLARLSRERPAAMPTILMACTVDEEYHLAGAPALAKLWSQAPSPLVPRARMRPWWRSRRGLTLWLLIRG